MSPGYEIDLRRAARRVQPSMDAVASPAVAAAARRTWLARMVNEHASSTVFEALAAQLERAGLPDEARTSRRFADDERRHGVLCGAVVEALGGEARATVPPRADFPEHDDVAPLEGALRNLLSMSCLSETVAVSLIGAERIEMPAGSLRDLVTHIYADEIEHARFGWSLVTRRARDVDAVARLRLGAYLCIAFAHLERHELAHLPIAFSGDPDRPVLGLCSGADARVLFYATIDQVIVPRLEALGLHAREAWTTRHPSRALLEADEGGLLTA